MKFLLSRALSLAFTGHDWRDAKRDRDVPLADRDKAMQRSAGYIANILNRPPDVQVVIDQIEKLPFRDSGLDQKLVGAESVHWVESVLA